MGKANENLGSAGSSGSVTEVESQVREIASRSKVASRAMLQASGAKLNELLETIASALEANAEAILEANAKDLERAKANDMAPGLQDRLALNPERVKALATATREIRALKSPVGEILWGRTLENGLKIKQLRVPVGVVAMIYEARPNVTVDAAALALKTNNTVILRGGSAARDTNRKLVKIIRDALVSQGLPEDAVTSLDDMGHEAVAAVLTQRGLVDLAIPRGGASLIQMVVDTAKVPVIETGVGNCHIYVDRSAKLDDAVSIMMNAKTQRVGVCNAAETLLVHQEVAAEFLSTLLPDLAAAGVRLHGDDATAKVAADYNARAATSLPSEKKRESGSTKASANSEAQNLEIIPATEEDWETEYLDYDLAIRVVTDLEEAIDHIIRYSSGHTEAVVAQDAAVIERFTAAIDSAVVSVNASTRFTDGGVFGFGAEIGISTQKLHARGPMGMEALTTQKSIVTGQGHIRD
ncbi:MAG: glutamate-5-semialdehyde dehydrogenase [Mobiluncus porci]|uniref:glutamate-5-semialdehyde dehydrogenase n=1 Tax=Mobiluncus porci TaxID=2652278 RepID=UPI0023F3D763|nr:glutamate-5-semialdehyde dehydrogenase [Mobiluncus porci]MDD7541656.1 glutamate-5-semialdehyde dehydrogenase [Mobiluncus porci]MDY5749227.1 glutamate-5-semialdehyde dehydrogenase [Mobiluncus porci]